MTQSSSQSESDGHTHPSFDQDEHQVNTPIDLPQSIGRYEVDQCIANGGQSSIFLGHDPRLNRPVAIKVPRVRGEFDNEVWQQFLHEARSVVPLKHKSIIPVLDVDRTVDGLPFVVMEYVDGEDLHTYWKGREFDLNEVLRIVQQIVNGLSFIHSHSTVHRDLKPSNIMIDRNGNVRIADFGLAMNIKDENRNKTVAGTTRFMAPEQLRGDNDKIQQQVDIWGVGVILFWMCAGEYPFAGDSIPAQKELIDRQEHPHLYECNSEVPKELDRICRNCLSESPSNRYWDAPELLNDINSLIRQLTMDNNQLSDKLPTRIHEIHEGPTHGQKIVPKGLLAYDAADSEFYLELMPEPRDRYGMPETLRFWLSRFRGPLHNSPLNLLSGAVGCGKTSFLRAALMPRLPLSTIPVYVECAAFQTEDELAQAIRYAITLNTGTSFPAEYRLEGVMSAIASGELLAGPRRALIILDQFEQWLASSENFSGKDYSASELARALRHCDGDQLTCMICVRDELWLEAAEFLKIVGGKSLREGQAAKTLTGFTLRHAANVLCKIGQAYSSFPESNTESPIEISQAAVEMIAQNEVVSGAHLAILASVLENREWTNETREELESWERCVAIFLDNQLTSRSAFIGHRRLLPQIESIISELLRPSTDRIPNSTANLMAACPMGTTQEAFQEALQLLEQRFRIVCIVPSPNLGDPKAGENFYRLTHPSLHQPLKNWLSASGQVKQTQPLKSEFNALSCAWAERNSSRFFPSLPSLVKMKWNSQNLVTRNHQAVFLKKATQYWVRKTALCALVLTVIGGTFFSVFSSLKKEQHHKDLYHSFLNCDLTEIGSILDEMKSSELDIRSLVDATSSKNDSASLRLRHELAICQSTGFSSDSSKHVLELAGQRPASESFRITSLLSEKVSVNETTEMLKTLATESSDRDTQLKLAVMAFEIGDNSLIESYLDKSNIDPTYLIHLRHRFRDFSVMSGNQLADRAIKGAPSTSLQLLIMTILLQDNTSYSALDVSLKSALIEMAKDVYRSSFSGTEHSLAKCVLQRNSAKLPVVIQDIESDDQLDYQWRCLQQGLTLIEVMRKNTGTFSSDRLFVSDTEVNLKQFRKFLTDEDYNGPKPLEITYGSGEDPETFDVWQYDKRYFPNNAYPVVRISARTAAMYCNWLSKKNGLEPFYSFQEDPFSFEAIPDANGFRLPTEVEGDSMLNSDEQFIGKDVDKNWYSEYVSNYEFEPDSEGSNFETGCRLPNSCGLFDSVGNVNEICVSFKSDSGELVSTSHSGFGSHEPMSLVYGKTRSNRKRKPTSHSAKAGFRVVLHVKK